MSTAGNLYKNFDFMKWTQIVLFLAIGIIVYVILRKIGIIPTKEQKEERKEKQEQEKKEEESENLTNYDYFDPNYWLDFSESTGLYAKRIELEDVDRYMKAINDAVGWYPFNSPSAVFAVFNELSYKTQVSYLAWFYAEWYGRDLGHDITLVLNDEDRVRLVEKIDKMYISDNYKKI